MRILKSLIIAFSMYSKIPMPQFKWTDEDMEYMLCFFPWIGAVIGVVLYFWNQICRLLGAGSLCYVLVGTAIPLLITGGFHVDGFMDTMDAFHSYQPKERKLEILKDSHIGAFSVIMLAVYGLLYIAGLSEICEEGLLKIVCAGFVLSRCLSGIAVVSFPCAKSDGLLHLFANHASKLVVKITLYLQCILCAGFMLWQDRTAGCVTFLTALLVYLYDYKKCKKELGGITGDTAGYFVVLCEVFMVLAVAACGLLNGI